jgi:hypothetical protein
MRLDGYEDYLFIMMRYMSVVFSGGERDEGSISKALT